MFLTVLLSLSRSKNQLPRLNQEIQEDLVTHASVYLLLKAGVQRTSGFCLINLTLGNGSTIIYFLLGSEMRYCSWFESVTCTKLTISHEGWKTNSVIPQKIVTLIFEYSDEVDKEKRGAKSMTILHYVWHVKSRILSLFCLFISSHPEPLVMEITLGLWDILTQRSCFHTKFLFTVVMFPGLRIWEI